MKRLDANINAQRAIALKANDPSLKWNQIAKEIGVSKATVYKWTQDAEFILAVEKKAVEIIGLSIPAVLGTLIKNATYNDCVQSANAILKMRGHLDKKVTIEHVSPQDNWENYLKSQNEVQNAEIEYIEVEPEDTPAPIKTIEQPKVKKKTEKDVLHNAKKRAKYNLKQKEWRAWKKRAKAVGVEPLSGGRPTAPQRKAWERKIEQKEEQQRHE